MPLPPRLRVPVRTASADGRYWGRWPGGDRPATAAELAAAAQVVAAAGGDIQTAIRLAGDALSSSVATGSAGSGVTSTPNLFYDGFESQVLRTTSGVTWSPTLNAAGVVWQSQNKTSIVTMESGVRYVVYTAGGAVAHNVNTDTAYSFAAKDGNYSLRFRYPNNDYIAEQRFSLTIQQPEMWIRFWLRVPDNFTHPSGNPDNHKLFIIWQGTEGGYNTHPYMNWEFWGNGSGGSNVAWHSRNVAGTQTGHTDSAPFISVPADRGRWMQIVFRIKVSDPGQTNGIAQMWRRWDGESAFTQIHNRTTVDLGLAPGSTGWSWGYFMGWSNALYAASSTEWLIDTIEMSTESLI